MTETGYEDARDGQSIRGGLTTNGVRNKATDYFLTDAGTVPWKMSKVWTAEYIKRKKKISLYEFQSAVFNKLQQYSPAALFWASPRASKSSWRQIQTSLHAFSFRSCLYKYHPSCVTTPAWFPPQILTILCRIKNRPFPLLKYSTVSVHYWHCSGRWPLRYSRITTGLCERVCKQHLHRCWPSYRPATGHGSGYLGCYRQPAGKFPTGETTGLCE